MVDYSHNICAAIVPVHFVGRSLLEVIEFVLGSVEDTVLCVWVI